jgi:hypothetical protein
MEFVEPIKAHESAAQLSDDFTNFLHKVGKGGILTSMDTEIIAMKPHSATETRKAVQ